MRLTKSAPNGYSSEQKLHNEGAKDAEIWAAPRKICHIAPAAAAINLRTRRLQ